MELKNSLVSIVQQASKVEEMLIESGGEITPEIQDALAVVDLKLPEKIDSYSYVMSRLESVSEYYKDKAEFYLRLSRSATNVVDHCKENLKFAMQELGTLEIAGNDFKFKLVNSNPACVIDDEALVDRAYTTTETIVSINKKRIIEDLKLGVPVPGAHLETKQSLRQYANNPAKGKK